MAVHVPWEFRSDARSWIAKAVSQAYPTTTPMASLQLAVSWSGQAVMTRATSPLTAE
jgi:hypothetical protein